MHDSKFTFVTTSYQLDGFIGYRSSNYIVSIVVLHLLQGFREGRFQVLVATDVAARGLDIPEVDLVIQCEPPKVRVYSTWKSLHY